MSNLITSLYASNGGKPKFNEFQTPVWTDPRTGLLTAGRVVHAYHDRPQEQIDDKTGKPELDANGIPKAGYKITLAWPKSVLDTELIPMRTLAATTRSEAWGPNCTQDQWFRLEAFLRDGDNPEHNTKRREYLFDHVYLNMKSKAVPIMVDGVWTKGYSGMPGLLDVYGADMQPVDLYAGCYARASGIMFGTEYMGKRYISCRLNNIQKAADGERMGGGGRPDAKSQFDPLATRPASAGGMGGLAGPGTPFGNVVL